MDPPRYQNFFSAPPKQPTDWKKLLAKTPAELDPDAAAKCTLPEGVTADYYCRKSPDPWPDMPEPEPHDPALIKKLWDQQAERAAKLSAMRAARDNETEKAESKEASKTEGVTGHIGREVSAEKALSNEDKTTEDANA